MHTETERKFLVKDPSYKNQAVSCLLMEQGYISRSEGRTVRVRISGETAWLTIKGPSANGLSRLEWEKEIPVQDAQDLMQLCTGGKIVKDRYLVPAETDGRTEEGHSVGNQKERFFEVDEFFGENDGLTTISSNSSFTGRISFAFNTSALTADS